MKQLLIAILFALKGDFTQSNAQIKTLTEQTLTGFQRLVARISAAKTEAINESKDYTDTKAGQTLSSANTAAQGYASDAQTAAQGFTTTAISTATTNLTTAIGTAKAEVLQSLDTTATDIRAEIALAKVADAFSVKYNFTAGTTVTLLTALGDALAAMNKTIENGKGYLLHLSGDATGLVSLTNGASTIEVGGGEFLMIKIDANGAVETVTDFKNPIEEIAGEFREDLTAVKDGLNDLHTVMAAGLADAGNALTTLSQYVAAMGN